MYMYRLYFLIYSLLYWTESGASPHITKASTMSPFSHSPLLSLPPSSSPAGITIDYLRRKLVWADENRRVIEMATLDGDDLTVLVSQTTNHPFQLTINGHRLYWTTQTSTFSSVSLISSDQSIVSLSILDVGDNPLIYGITTIDDNKRQGNGKREIQYMILNHHPFIIAYHVCLLNSIQCSHYCTVNSTGSPVCTCPVGYVLLSDGKSCASMFLSLITVQ